MKDTVQKRLDLYNCKTAEEEENALKEITQEVALYALAKHDFFKEASFQGGTCLRIIHGLDRFSEDLDFCLVAPNPNYQIAPFLEKAAEVMNEFGFTIEVSGKDREDSSVQMRFLKDNSIKMILKLHHNMDKRRKIKIKVEVDTTPPLGAEHTKSFLDFPLDFAIASHNLPSLFAGKCHALLCRSHTKGRDWYDFSWYVTRKVVPNFQLLSHSLHQFGPWADQNLNIDAQWLEQNLRLRIKEIDWQEAKRDVSRFLKPDYKETLELWNEEFFLAKLEKMKLSH